MSYAAINPRLAAGALVSAVTDGGRTLEAAMAADARFNALTGRDRAFAHAVAAATLRRLGGIDQVLGAFLERPLPETAVAARALLRTGAAQMLALGAPAHAAVSETVALAKQGRTAAGMAGLINAVLRRVDREGRALFAAQAPGADLPAWLFQRWRAAYGDAQAAAIAAALRTPAPLDLAARDDPAAWADALGGALTPSGAIRLPPECPPVPALAGFSEGAWWVQDAAAGLPARLFGDVRGRRVLDLCAAPGGKTMQLAAAGAHVTALDSDAQRLGRLRENLARTGLSAEIICADARSWAPAAAFDAVLLDAPCTATGTLRRRPDAAWLRRPTDIPALAALQAELLTAAARLAAPGGTIVYAVCSLEPEEGPEVIARAAARLGLVRAPLDAALACDPAFLTPDGDLRTLPSHWPEIGGLDGFYAARLTKA